MEHKLWCAFSNTTVFRTGGLASCLASQVIWLTSGVTGQESYLTGQWKHLSDWPMELPDRSTELSDWPVELPDWPVVTKLAMELPDWPMELPDWPMELPDWPVVYLTGQWRDSNGITSFSVQTHYYDSRQKKNLQFSIKGLSVLFLSGILWHLTDVCKGSTVLLMTGWIPPRERCQVKGYLQGFWFIHYKTASLAWSHCNGTAASKFGVNLIHDKNEFSLCAVCLLD